MNNRDPRGRPEVTAIPLDADQAGYFTGSAEEAALERGRFLMRVYGHLLGAILAFVAIEVYFFKTGLAWTLTNALLGVNWLLVLGGFMVAGWLARGLAARADSAAMQYLGLGLYVVAQAVIFAPLLYIAESYTGGGVIGSAALLTLLAFVGLTLIAWQTRRDFTFLGGLLRWAGVLALLAIGGGVLFGWELGMWFSVLMIGVAGGAILYDTSNIMNHWPGDRHVGAALELFASVALMFWYILRLFMGNRR
jgi:FtsH-binding integral membrane protein